jgi:4-hydroxy-3-polyprenylbenzoate decarboxylase
VHLENLTQVTRAGAVVLPAMPSFYGKPQSVEDLVDTVIGRILDHLGLPNTLSHRWGDKK